MVTGIADTHTAIWYLFGDPRISATAKTFIDQTTTQQHRIQLAPISLVEVVYLIEKNRLPASAYTDLRKALSNPYHVLKEAPFTAEVVEALRRIPRDLVPDMPDRIIAATAMYLNVPVISRDSRIQTSGIQTIW